MKINDDKNYRRDVIKTKTENKTHTNHSRSVGNDYDYYKERITYLEIMVEGE